MATPTKPGLYPRGGPNKAHFDDPANAIEPREIVIAEDTGEIGTQHGWLNPAGAVGGKVKNIYFAETPAVRQTISSQTPTVIDGLSITITPETETSTFIVVASIHGTMTHVTSLLCYVNGTSLYSHSNGNQAGSIGTYYDGTNVTTHMKNMPLNAKYNAVGLDPVTIDIRATSSWSTSVYTLYINDRAANDMRSISTMVIYEVERQV